MVRAGGMTAIAEVFELLLLALCALVMGGVDDGRRVAAATTRADAQEALVVSPLPVCWWSHPSQAIGTSRGNR